MLPRKRFSIAAISAIVALLSYAPSAQAGSTLHEYPNGAILELSCTRTVGQSLALVVLTPQDGGTVRRVSTVFTAGAAIRSPLIERDIQVDEPARAGHIFFGSPITVSVTGSFSGFSLSGNPTQYPIPAGFSTPCEPPI
ncbi:MAG: hypothetical protein AAFV90_24255 [Cyanobacteria bacterium J06634_5]